MSKEIEAKNKRLVETRLRAARRILKTAEGDSLMALLDTFYKPDMPVFQVRPDKPLDPLEAAVKDGQRDVINFLRSIAKDNTPEED